jgi:hypothetical protein
MTATPVNVSRMIRIATLLLTLLAGSLVYCAYEPSIGALDTQLDDAESELRSDDVAFSEIPRLRAERAELASRYDEPFRRSEDAAFLGAVAAAVKRHDVVLLSTTVAADEPAATETVDRRPHFRRTSLSLELHGSYSHLLATIADLSGAADIARVGIAALRRDGAAITASIPVTLVEPMQGGPE